LPGPPSQRIEHLVIAEGHVRVLHPGINDFNFVAHESILQEKVIKVLGKTILT
jgi:hypothetical protein